MSSLIVVLLAFVALSSCLRTVSYNIRSGENISGEFNITLTGITIASFNPDLVGIQEVDNYTQRHYVDEPAILSQVSIGLLLN
jgi:endonuclease/exonuclease/phosphatase family metal-dependent hydrolase